MHARAGFDSAAAEKIFTAQPGEVLPPMKTGQGYMLVKVEQFICSYHPEAEFIDMLLLERFGESELFRKWITELKSKSSISIVDPSMKAFRLFRSGRYDQAGAL
jgi:parvulin-like peptidyl-prolyl isomerase